jgi:mono/diheme cytochrome c family protein
VLLGGSFVLVLPDFFSARREASSLEEPLVRRLRLLSIPSHDRSRLNPIPFSDEVLEEARAHFADHCAFCHGQDGRGNLDLGAAFHPPVPDLTEPSIQSRSDGELYYAIQNGIRFSGMPAWGAGGGHASSSWALVHLIRHLPEEVRTGAGGSRDTGEDEKTGAREAGDGTKPGGGSHDHAHDH